MIRIPARTLIVIALAAVFVAGCGGSSTTKTERTVSAEPTHGTYTGDGATDQVITAALASKDIDLAGLVGYQKVACKKDSAQGPNPPACRDTEADGALVEVLPATTACANQWVRPEQVPDIFRADLPTGKPVLTAVAVPAPNPAAFGGGFGADQVAIFRTGAHPDGQPMGVALHIKDGRVVWIESDCANAQEFLGADRVASYIIDPNGTVTPPTPVPAASATPEPAPSPIDTPAQ
jgi:hypothetical protein